MGTYSPNFIANYLQACARHNPDDEVLCCGPHRLTRGALRDRVFGLASALRGAGLAPGERVALVLHNCPEFIEAAYAAQVAGAVPVPVNYRFTGPEVARQVAHAGAAVLIYHAHWREAAAAALPHLPALRLLVPGGGEGAPAGAAVAAVPYEDLLGRGGATDPGVRTTAGDVAVIIYTGGTTGFPKGAMLTYRAHLEMFASLLASVVSEGARVTLTPRQLARVAETAPLPAAEHLVPLLRLGPLRRALGSDLCRALCRPLLRLALARPELARLGYGHTVGYAFPSLPFFHDAAFMLLLLGLMAGSLRYVLVPDQGRFSSLTTAETLARERPFLVANVPTGWKKLLADPGVQDGQLASVRVAITGAGLCPVSLKRELFRRMPEVILVDMFGQTEMAPLTAFRIDASPHTLKERSVGRPIVQARVVDERGRPLPPGEVGQIVYRARSTMKGYLDDPAGTARYLAGGWCRSGDVGYLDAEGELRVLDRLAECINTGGEKVFPLEVEEVLGEQPGVEAACVIGVPDEQWGNALRAVVQPAAGVTLDGEALRRACRERLAGFKVPRSVVLVPQLPLSPVGKVLRARVRELYGG